LVHHSGISLRQKTADSVRRKSKLLLPDLSGSRQTAICFCGEKVVLVFWLKFQKLFTNYLLIENIVFVKET